MKVLCMLEYGGDGPNDLVLQHAVRNLPKAEIATGYWGEKDADLAAQIRRIEVEGPEPQQIPSAFYEHKDAEIMVGSFCPFSQKGLAVFENLKILGVIRAGMENVNISAATAQGIAVVNASGRNADSVSDFAVGLLLAECRNIARGHIKVMEGDFERKFSNSGRIPDLRGKTVGLFGFGYIGKLVAEKLSGFHVDLIVYDPFLKPDDVKEFNINIRLTDKETFFKNSDFISVHARYTEESHHVIGEKELSLMKPTAYLINTARAGLIDYGALARALAEKRIAGAGLDVFEEEPLAANDPLLKLENVTLTPHIAGATVDAANNSPRLIFERICKILKAEKEPALLNPDITADLAFQEWRERAIQELF
jgi:D-3-phosphoglycerate dehydrogenase